MRTYLTMAATAALAWLPPSTGAAAAQETTVARRRSSTCSGRSSRPARRRRPHPPPGGRAGPRTSAELDALADQVAAIAADATLPGDVRWEAKAPWRNAASPSGRGYGTPYPRAFDLLVQVYEGGYHHALYTIMRADSVRGMA